MSKQNKKDYLIRRYIVFLIGLSICSFGVACITKAGLGTSPVAAIPYTLSLVFLVVGCFILALGVYLELLGRVGMLSGDAFIKAIAVVTKNEYGNVKIITDISMTIISAVIAFVSLHKLVGVREGTVIAAVIVGMIIKLYTKCLKKIAVRIISETI